MVQVLNLRFNRYKKSLVLVVPGFVFCSMFFVMTKKMKLTVIRWLTAGFAV